MLNKEYWNKRYIDKDTPWDTGTTTQPITNFIDHITDKDARILFPGSGRAYNAIYAYEQGYKNTFICDWADSIIESIQEQHPSFPSANLLNADFFKLEEKYDYIIEQTFFCALHPSMRGDYVSKVAEMLNDGGKLAGLLFNIEFAHEGPPFGGTIEDYRKIFSSHLDIEHLEVTQDSIKPRLGNEAFIIAGRK